MRKKCSVRVSAKWVTWATHCISLLDTSSLQLGLLTQCCQVQTPSGRTMLTWGSKQKVYKLFISHAASQSAVPRGMLGQPAISCQGSLSMHQRERHKESRWPWQMEGTVVFFLRYRWWVHRCLQRGLWWSLGLPGCQQCDLCLGHCELGWKLWKARISRCLHQSS